MIRNNIEELSGEIKNIAKSYLSSPKAELNLCMMMQEIFEKAEAYAEKNVSEAELKHMDCKAGCSTCCRVNVSVLMPEAVIIKNFLMKTKADPELDEQIFKMKTLAKHIKYLEEDERILANKPCAFLNEKGACDIYPVRPLICRSVTSADSGACKEAMTMLALNENILIPMNIMQKSVMDTAFIALASALGEHGLKNDSFEMTSAVLDLM
ncbi:MAG: YkgJ family cysteine cluster protein [Deferribacterales bacterium]